MDEGIKMRLKRCWVCGGPVEVTYAQGDLVYRCTDERVYGDRDAIIGDGMPSWLRASA